jgi:hypothetical protein
MLLATFVNVLSIHDDLFESSDPKAKKADVGTF